MYEIKSSYYASPDQFGESFILTSDNGEVDMRLEIGQKVRIVPICLRHGCCQEATVGNMHCRTCDEIITRKEQSNG